MNQNFNNTKVITGVNTRWSYCNVWEPKSINGGTPKYSMSLIIQKTNTVTVKKIKKAIETAYKKRESKLKGREKSVPALQAIKTPLRDGNLERLNDEAYKGCYFINVNSLKSPEIVDAACQPIIDHSEVCSEVYERASLFNKFLGTFEKAIKIVDEMDKEEDINDSLGALMGNIFPQQDNFDLKKSIIASLLFVMISCSLIFFYALFGCIIAAIF